MILKLKNESNELLVPIKEINYGCQNNHLRICGFNDEHSIIKITNFGLIYKGDRFIEWEIVSE